MKYVSVLGEDDGMKELAICSGSHFVNDCRLQIDHHCAWHVLAGTGFAEEGVE
jgi:hypothetical protein